MSGIPSSSKVCNRTSNAASRRCLAVLAAALLACHCRLAAADVPEDLAPARILGNLAFNFLTPPPIEVETFGAHRLAGPNGLLRLDSGLSPSPFLRVEVAEIRNDWFGRSAAFLEYEMLVAGPEGSVPVTMHVSGAVAGQAAEALDPASSGAFALAATYSITNVTAATPLFVEGGIRVPQRSGSHFDSFDDVVALDLLANRRYKVQMIADAGVRNRVPSAEDDHGFAFVDPVFTFGPGVGPEYSFVFSTGVGNLPIPEPRSYVLMGAGLLLIWSVISRRRMRS